eukprot:scaffold207_cov409-Prasinococcus_capsulatus_cf.AAC.96
MTWHKSQGPNSLKGGKVSAGGATSAGSVGGERVADCGVKQQQQQQLVRTLKVESLEKLLSPGAAEEVRAPTIIMPVSSLSVTPSPLLTSSDVYAPVSSTFLDVRRRATHRAGHSSHPRR